MAIQQDWDKTKLADYLAHNSWKTSDALNILVGYFMLNTPFSSKHGGVTEKMASDFNHIKELWYAKPMSFKKFAGGPHSPAYFIEWAMSVNHRPVWLDWAIEHNLYSSETLGAVKYGITKGAVINAFEGMHFDRDQWSKYLASPPKWLEECRVAKGNKKTSATWNPVLIAVALYDKKASIKKLDAVFVGLKNWTDEWQEASALFRD